MTNEIIAEKETIELIKLVENWYEEHGTRPIPEESDSEWDQLSERQRDLFPILYEATYLKFCYRSEDEVTDVPGRMLPFFVGVRLGFSETALQKILENHNVQSDCIESIEYDGTKDRFVVLITSDGEEVTDTDFNIKLLSAFSKIRSEQLDTFDSVSSIHALGLMHTDIKRLWPSSAIDVSSARSSTSLQGTVDLPEDDFAFVISRIEKKSQFPNNSMTDFLKRSGMLTKGVRTKDTVAYSMWEELLNLCINDSKVHQDLLDFCLSHPNPELKSASAQALLSLNEDSMLFLPDVDKLIGYLEPKLDATGLSSILSSPTLLLNVVKTDEADVMMADVSNIPQYRSLFSQPDLVLQKLAKEAMSTPPGEYGLSQFTAFTKLGMLGLPAQRTDGFSPEALVNHVLDGLASYCTQKTVAGQSQKPSLDNDARTGFRSLLTMLTLNHDLDCSTFVGRSYAEKRLLIDVGLDIQKLGFSVEETGKVFGEDLGL